MYISGTQGAQANCASVFMGTLDTALVAAGFVFVDQVVATSTYRVYRSPAASNFFGSDWYLNVGRSSDTSTSIAFGVFELYDAAAHLARNYAPSATSGLTPTSVFAVNDAAGKSPDSSTLKQASLAITTTGFGYWMSLNLDRVVIATRTTIDYAVYAGLYDDLQSSAISPFPLVVQTLETTTSTAAGSATREPSTTTSNTNNFLVDQLASWTTSPAADGYSGKAWMSRARIQSRRGANVYMRGLLRGVWYSALSGANGDTTVATIDGATKTLVQTRSSNGGSNGAFVDTEV